MKIRIRLATLSLGFLLLAGASTTAATPVTSYWNEQCNNPAPEWFRDDIAEDGQGLHHQTTDIQDLFFSVFTDDDDLHVRSWAWQHNCALGVTMLPTTPPATVTSNPSPTEPVTRAPSAKRTRTSTVKRSSTVMPTPTAIPTPMATPSPTATPTAIPTVMPTTTPIAMPEATPTPAATRMAKPTRTSIATPTSTEHITVKRTTTRYAAPHAPIECDEGYKDNTHGVCVTNDPDYYCNSHFKPPSDREIVWHGYVGAPDGPQETWIVKGKCGDLSVWFS